MNHQHCIKAANQPTTTQPEGSVSAGGPFFLSCFLPLLWELPSASSFPLSQFMSWEFSLETTQSPFSKCPQVFQTIWSYLWLLCSLKLQMALWSIGRWLNCNHCVRVLSHFSIPGWKSEMGNKTLKRVIFSVNLKNIGVFQIEEYD